MKILFIYLVYIFHIFPLNYESSLQASKTYFWIIYSEGVPSCLMIFKKGFLENQYLSSNQNSTPGKSVLYLFGLPIKGLLENRYLFGSQKSAPGKIGICIWWTDIIYLPGKNGIWSAANKFLGNCFLFGEQKRRRPWHILRCPAWKFKFNLKLRQTSPDKSPDCPTWRQGLKRRPLEIYDLFDEQNNLPGKSVSVLWKHYFCNDIQKNGIFISSMTKNDFFRGNLILRFINFIKFHSNFSYLLPPSSGSRTIKGQISRAKYLVLGS